MARIPVRTTEGLGSNPTHRKLFEQDPPTHKQGLTHQERETAPGRESRNGPPTLIFSFFPFRISSFLAFLGTRMTHNNLETNIQRNLTGLQSK